MRLKIAPMSKAALFLAGQASAAIAQAGTRPNVLADFFPARKPASKAGRS